MLRCVVEGGKKYRYAALLLREHKPLVHYFDPSTQLRVLDKTNEASHLSMEEMKTPPPYNRALFESNMHEETDMW